MEGKFISDEKLKILIEGLEDFKKKGIYDPWIFSDGETVQPLDVLKELREHRLINDIKGMVKNDKTDNPL